MRTVAIIQARLRSTRLPNKVLSSIAGKPMLSHVIERTRAIQGVDAIVLTIPDHSADYKLYDFAAGCYVATGPETDLTRRYQIAADLAGADRIVRITSDCPLLDPKVAEHVLHLQEQRNAPYASNVHPSRSWPDGLDVEVFTREALDALTEPDEHCTTRLRTAEAPCLIATVGLGHLKWSVDRPEELDFVRCVFEQRPADYAMLSTLKAIERGHLWPIHPKSDDYQKMATAGRPFRSDDPCSSSS